MAARRGMSAQTGEWLTGIDHLTQSVADILNTTIGGRVERRDYGSRLPRRVDRPIDDALRVDIVGDIYDALTKWEPDLALSSVLFEGVEEARLVCVVTGLYRPEGREITIRVDLTS